MFKYSCFTENTPEMREWLEKIGYKPYQGTIFTDADSITTSSDGYYYTLDFVEMEGVIGQDTDCRNNPDLFKALTAVREDSDYLQWYTEPEFNLWICWKFKKIPFKVNSTCTYHKADRTELQEHFKKMEK